jgi:phage minor structural protein
MLYIFDSTEKLITTLPKGSFFNAVHYEVLNGENTFEFTVPAGSEYVVEGNLVAFRDLDSYWQIFEIKRIVDVHGDGLTRTAYCEHIFYELLDDIVTDKRPSAGATAALSGMLENTRWQAGIVDDLGASSTSAYYISALEAVQKVAEAWQGELNWRCVINGGVITRYVDLRVMVGTDTGKQFVYSKDILNIEREVDSSSVVTALYGRGKGIELESGSYGRRLTFANVVAADKPAGQEWVGDDDALSRWGRNGRHRFDVFIDEEETDPEVLLQKTRDELARRKVPRVTYRLDVVSLEQLTGYEHEKVRLGDMVRVIDREFKPELVVSARVIELERDLLSPENTKVVLGSFAPTIVEATVNTNRRINEMANRPFNTKWLDGKISVLQNEIENVQSYVFQTGEDGILILDAPTYDQATKAMKLGGGMFAIANQKDGNGGWNWRTFGDGSGFTADLITAGMIDAGLVQIGPQTTFAPGYDPSQIEGAAVGMGVEADCLGLWHFDGSLNSHKGVAAVGDANFETGIFGQAVKVEEGTTNYLNGASDIASPFVGGTLVTKPEVVSPCGDVVIEWTAGRNDDYTSFKGAVSCSAGEKVTVSIWARKISSSANCEFYFSHDGTYSNFNFSPTLEWQRYSFTVTCTGTTTVSTRLDNNIQGDIVQFSGWQLEKKPYPTPFVDGTRLGVLKFPTTGLSASQGTISFRAKNLAESGNGSVLIDLPDSTNTEGLRVGISGDDKIYVEKIMNWVEEPDDFSQTETDFSTGTLNQVWQAEGGLQIATTTRTWNDFTGESWNDLA